MFYAPLLGLKSFVTIMFLCRLQGKSQIVQDELVRLGESMVTSSEGTRALALELCREFEDKFLQHIMTGEVIFHNYDLRDTWIELFKTWQLL